MGIVNMNVTAQNPPSMLRIAFKRGYTMAVNAEVYKNPRERHKCMRKGNCGGDARGSCEFGAGDDGGEGWGEDISSPVRHAIIRCSKTSRPAATLRGIATSKVRIMQMRATMPTTPPKRGDARILIGVQDGQSEVGTLSEHV